MGEHTESTSSICSFLRGSIILTSCLTGPALSNAAQLEMKKGEARKWVWGGEAAVQVKEGEPALQHFTFTPLHFLEEIFSCFLLAMETLGSGAETERNQEGGERVCFPVHVRDCFLFHLAVFEVSHLFGLEVQFFTFLYQI